MPKPNLYVVLESVHISEKASLMADNRQFVFKVARDANKADVKRSVEKLFEVTVSNVAVLNVKGKRKNFSKTKGKRAGWKKAYVTLAEGFDIDLAPA